MKRLGGTVRIRRASACALALFLVVAPACGGSSRADDVADGRRASSDRSEGGSTDTGGGERGSRKSRGDGKAKSDKKDGGSSATPTTAAGSSDGSGSGTTTTTEDPWAKTMPISAELTESCVRPGGSQGITIKAEPASGVGYDSVYSDGKSGMMEGFYGGNAGGFTNEEGVYTSTWVVAPHAPEGPVIVRVLGTHVDAGFGETRVYFAVSNALGTCQPFETE